jgi:hypothetical protein
MTHILLLQTTLLPTTHLPLQHMLFNFRMPRSPGMIRPATPASSSLVAPLPRPLPHTARLVPQHNNTLPCHALPRTYYCDRLATTLLQDWFFLRSKAPPGMMRPATPASSSLVRTSATPHWPKAPMPQTNVVLANDIHTSAGYLVRTSTSLTDQQRGQ